MSATVIGAATVAIWTYLLFFRGGFWRVRRDDPPAPPAVPLRSVVAVVPARDEAAVIGRAVVSLLGQSHPGLRIVLIDDQSSDGTADIARAAAAALGAGDRLSICRGTPVPRGWTGKLWAMQQGVAAARSLRPDYLLLTDADIVHAPGNLAELIARAESGGYDLVSLMVKLNCRSPWERLLIPAFVFFFFKLYPPRWVADPARRTSAAAGGCMLIRRAALERIGGIERIRGEIIDDCALARMVKREGLVWLGSATETCSIREYASPRAIWGMVARCAFAQLGYSATALILMLSALAVTYLAPPLLLLSRRSSARLCGAVSWMAMSAAFAPTVRAYGGRGRSALLLPAIALFYTAATIASAVMFWRGRGGYWKGRFQAVAASR
ncbi:MAG TPA: glycosyltransferase [Stellaceae bacterium]|nr:glycosyltransferase [Stellaceae bacterium]